MTLYEKIGDTDKAVAAREAFSELCSTSFEYGLANPQPNGDWLTEETVNLLNERYKSLVASGFLPDLTIGYPSETNED